MRKIAAILLTILLLTATAFAEDEYRLGMGAVVRLDGSGDGVAQMDATFAAVVLDGEGRIVQCRIDSAESRVEVEDGVVDAEGEFLTKRQLGDNYGMVAYGGAADEWYRQAEAFEAYVVGRTAGEVAEMETMEDGGSLVVADETLSATCTIDVSDFIEAVVKACEDEQARTFSAAEGFELGLSAITRADGSADATDTDDAVVRLTTDFAASVVVDGRLVAAVVDSMEPVIRMDEDGEVTEASFDGSKREQGFDYGMVAYGGAVAEWCQQAQAFVDYAVGRTADEIRDIEIADNADGAFVAADEALYAGCTIQITEMMDAVAQAAEDAR